NTMSPRVISLACLGETNTVPPPPPGGQNKPFLSAWPSPVVPQGQHVTLHCRSHHKFEAFRLYKDNDIFISKLHSTISQYGVLIGPVTPEHAGTYSCQGSYHNSPSLWSAPSDPLVIVVTGIYRKPSLLAQSGRLVKSRGNVTLVCCSEILFESFILHREGVSKDHLYRAGQHHHGGSHANFSMGPVTAAHAGTYRCFGSLNHSSHVWSAPSDPLDIMITDNPRHQHVLAVPLVVIVFLAVLLFFLSRQWCPPKEGESWEVEASTCLGRSGGAGVPLCSG
uniref:Immunoglobulin domain-containing protein n=1 Tax=Neovison vison TaxID=452646 RepID=A0A8C7BJQ8_NEOVI